MQNATEYNGTEGLTLKDLINQTEQEALAAQFYRKVAAQYIQLTYSDKDSLLATRYNYLAYACNHIMVLLGDLMSYFSCNSVNKQLKTDVLNLTKSERATLYLACVDEEIKEEFNDNVAKLFLNDYIDAAYEVPSFSKKR